MSKQNPRVALTVPADLNDLLDKVASYQGIPKTRLITEILIEAKPIFEQMLLAYEQLEQNKEGALEVLKNFGSQAVADASTRTAELAQELAQMQKGKKHD